MACKNAKARWYSVLLIIDESAAALARYRGNVTRARTAGRQPRHMLHIGLLPPGAYRHPAGFALPPCRRGPALARPVAAGTDLLM